MATKGSLNLSDDQRFELMKLRRNVADCCTKPYHNDYFLLRWLKARNFNAAAAEKMLRESIKWREQWGVETIMQDWSVPEVFKTYYPSGICGFDKDGAPIIVIPFSGVDIWGILHSVTKTDFIKMTIRTLESHLELARKQAEVHGPLAGQVVALIDMTGFNIRQYAWRPAGEVILNMIQMYEANYPEILKACYIINVPKVFALAFSVVKNFLNDYTINKIQIYKADPAKWQPVLLKQIPASNLPMQFGGDMVDPDGDPRCPSKICQGGKIPKSFYLKNNKNEKTAENKDKYTTATVKKGDKLCINYLAAEEGSFLRWCFHTEGHDIKFGILCKDEDGKEIVIVPSHRVACHQTEEIGAINCTVAPATYTVVFDNTYSFLRGKKIHYSIAVSPPITSKDGEVYEDVEE